MNSDILFYAFRYALGRMSYCVHTVVNEIISNWITLDRGDQMLYQKEIRKAISGGRAGMKMGVESWELVLELEVSHEQTQS